MGEFISEVSKWTQVEVYEWAVQNFDEDVASCLEDECAFNCVLYSLMYPDPFCRVLID